MDEYVERTYRSMMRQRSCSGCSCRWRWFSRASTHRAVHVGDRATNEEIGIRKAMGAGRGREIVKLLLWQFTRPVLMASLIACPITAWLMHRWLQQFAYRIDLTPWPFIACAAAALGVALATVAGHCYTGGTREAGAGAALRIEKRGLHGRRGRSAVATGRA